MEYIVILFVIITVVSSIIRAAGKSSARSGNPPAYKPYFPPLSVDAPAQTPAQNVPPQENMQQYYWEGGGPESRLDDQYTGAYDLSQTAQDISLEMADLPQGTQDGAMPGDVSPDNPVNVNLSEFKPDIPLTEAKDAANPPPALAFNRLSFLSNRTELAKAIIYSEILRPKFKSR